jgi:hypothetical protein
MLVMRGMYIRILKPVVWGSLVYPQNRGKIWPDTATLVVHVDPRRIPLVTGRCQISACIVEKLKNWVRTFLGCPLLAFFPLDAGLEDEDFDFSDRLLSCFSEAASALRALHKGKAHLQFAS